MEHHVCMVFGDSSCLSNCKKWDKPIAGIGQGNGAGPHIWEAGSSLLFEIMQSNGFFVIIQCAIFLDCKDIVGFSFVNDMDLCVFFLEDSHIDVAQKMQQAVTTWEGQFHVMGGSGAR